MLKKLWDYKKIRFLCIGSFNSLTDITILNILVFAGHLPVWVVNAFSVSVGITISYFLNHFLVFRHQHKPNYKLFIKFFSVTGISIIVLQTFIIYLTRPLYNSFALGLHGISASFSAKISLNLAKITAILIGMVWNYLLYSRVVFKKTLEDVVTEELTRNV
jgi:putative flippase GtrA